MSRKKSGGGKSRKLREQPKKKHPRIEIEGVARMNREGNLFVSVDGIPDPIFVRPGKSRGALHEDKVRVVITKKQGRQGPEGEIVSILERSGRPFVGILHVVGNRQAWVLMSSRTMPYDISVPVPDKEHAVTGMKVAAVVDRWDRGEPVPSGHIVDFLGMPGENDTEMHAILAQFGLPYRFEKQVEDAADKISDQITDKDLKGRRDFRDVLTFTIDPTDAKDYDDALSFRPLENGNFEVGVHIADVTWYVRPGSEVDKEAMKRGTSVYLVDRTVPMLPEKLSNKLCSLRPNEEKLTFSAVFEITPLAKVINPWFGRTIIKSDYRFDYELAQQIIEGGSDSLKMEELGKGSECGIVPVEIRKAVLELHKLAAIFRKRRFAAGALEFDRPEMKVKIDENGKPIDVVQKVSKESNWLIEEFMLLANRFVAEFVATDGHFGGKAAKKAKTFVYRIHDLPNTEKLTGLRSFAGNFGHTLGDIGNGKAIAESLNNLIVQVGDRPEKNAIQLLMLRAMAKATYSTENIGHYGLAFKFYTHFTSPIRRYPDMMVHRLLSLYLGGAESQDRGYYEQQCQHASEREIIAAEAERESIKYKIVEFMQDKIGQEYEGYISGLTEWGIYVEIEPTKVEGMIPLRTIKGDFFTFDEEHYRTVGRRTGKKYYLGDKVRIRVKETNLEQKLLDYELIEEGFDAPAPRKDVPERPPRGKARGGRAKSGR
jgi:ribonuclease R